MINRENILGKLRRSLKVPTDDNHREAVVRARLETPVRGVVPKRGYLDLTDQINLFQAKAEAVAATVQQLGSYDDLPAAVANWLRDHNRAPKLRMGSDDRLTQPDWSQAPTLERMTGPSDGTDLVTLSHADTGIAETGTLILTSGDANPTSLNFLPEDHLVVLDAEDLVASMEAAWDRLRQAAPDMPRTVNMITGPSRSADIGQKLVLGAHGPQNLHIFIITKNGA
ncbi:LutC/YkgG family protein [Coralliovum pocilloporae]|uniref:LutC/YkgG family protein n=1 Tax=Coralliovum pocilloporae TaxID=3066369 RepID=UPI003306B167